MKALIAVFLLLPFSAFLNGNSAARTNGAGISDIQTAGGFMDICGAGESASKITLERIKSDPSFTIEKALEAKLSEQSLCLGYSVGLLEGWKEGHDDGVLTAHLPNGIVPFDLEPSLKTLSTKDISMIRTEMNADIPCEPEHVTVGDIRDAMVSYIRAQQAKNPFIGMALMRRIIHPAMLAAFPCKKPEIQGLPK